MSPSEHLNRLAVVRVFGVRVAGQLAGWLAGSTVVTLTRHQHGFVTMQGMVEGRRQGR